MMATDCKPPPSSAASAPPTTSLDPVPLNRLRLKALEEENLQLKCLVGEQALYIRELEKLLSR